MSALEINAHLFKRISDYLAFHLNNNSKKKHHVFLEENTQCPENYVWEGILGNHCLLITMELLVTICSSSPVFFGVLNRFFNNVKILKSFMKESLKPDVLFEMCF